MGAAERGKALSPHRPPACAPATSWTSESCPPQIAHPTAVQDVCSGAPQMNVFSRPLPCPCRLHTPEWVSAIELLTGVQAASGFHSWKETAAVGLLALVSRVQIVRLCT
ncbi:T-Cell Surface Antigen Cd2 [Manis pentadactyla]|nr:T-Cell Surface Antigen Cd2 [Manis pentadactyla]